MLITLFLNQFKTVSYFTGENLCYWSPLKKHSRYVDPEAAIDRSDAYNNAYYPWQKSFLFGIDVTF